MTPANPFFIFYQRSPRSTWICAPAEDRERIVAEHKPPFVTALTCDNDFSTILTSEQLGAVCYRGDFFTDFDGELDEVIPQVQKFIGKLQAHDVNLAQCSLACTGNRGLHLTIPQACFMPAVPQEGIAGLPHVYREMAHSLFCDTLDLRIYSLKRGRAFRTFGTKHDSTGLFKVAVSLDEVMRMSPETYKALCAAPRDLITPEPPTLAKGLAALFIACRDKAFSAQSKRKLTSIATSDFKKRTGGTVPPTLADLMGGRLVMREGKGWNDATMQLATAAHALDLTEDQLIDQCRGLINQHQGDSERYGTARKRESTLRDQYRYMQDNPAYTVSIPGLLSILPEGCPANDLRDMIADVPDKGFPTCDLMTGQGRSRRLRTDIDALLQLVIRDPRLENLCFYDEHLACLSATRSWREAMQMPHAPSNIDELNDDHALALQHWFAAEWKLDIGKEKAFSVLRSWCMATSRNPIKGRALSWAKNWDGEARLDTWLIDHCNAACTDDEENDTTPLIRAFGTKFLISVMSRIFNPGCQVDTMLVLAGGQGVRKSTVLRAIGEAIDPRCYADSFDIGDHSKDRLQKLRGKCLIEWAEMSGLTKRDVREVKTFLTERNDEYRAPYDRCVRKWPRTAVFAGSTNNDELLADETGGRRFWIVRVAKTITREQVAKFEHVLPQILGEAVARYRQGERWWIDPEDEAQLHALAEAAQESVAVFTQFDSLALNLAKNIRSDSSRALKDIADMSLVPMTHSAWFPQDVVERMLVNLNDGSGFSPMDWKSMSSALLRQGWERKRIGRTKIMCYKVGEKLSRRVREDETANA